MMEATWTRVGSYVVCREDESILLTRFVFPGHPDSGRWTLPGGGMEWGESARQTAERELFEETGLTATIGSVIGVFSRWMTDAESVRGTPGHFVGIIHQGLNHSGQLRTDFTDTDTTDGAEWFRVENLDGVPHVELVDFAVSRLTSH